MGTETNVMGAAGVSATEPLAVFVNDATFTLTDCWATNVAAFVNVPEPLKVSLPSKSSVP